MLKIQVTPDQLSAISTDLDDPTEPFTIACELGFPGFAGGLDHVSRTKWSLTLHDRGMSSGSGTRDNTTQFVVPQRKR